MENVSRTTTSGSESSERTGFRRNVLVVFVVFDEEKGRNLRVTVYNGHRELSLEFYLSQFMEREELVYGGLSFLLTLRQW